MQNREGYARPSIQVLESRVLLASDFVFAGVNKAGKLTLVGTPGDDHYVVTSSDPGLNEKIRVDRDGDVIVFDQRKVLGIRFDGGAGNDYVEISPLVNGGNATLMGGDGRDTLIGGQLFDRIDGGPGGDLLEGGNQRDTIFGDGGNDRIFGNAKNDVIFGGPGNDKINGGPGDDQIDAGSGRDTISAAGGNDTINGGDGIDTGLDLNGLNPSPISVEVLT